MNLINYLKNYLKKSNTNPANSTNQNPVESLVIKIENNPNDITEAFVHVRCANNKTIVYLQIMQLIILHLYLLTLLQLKMGNVRLI